jgi:hypothetical protein
MRLWAVMVLAYALLAVPLTGIAAQQPVAFLSGCERP